MCGNAVWNGGERKTEGRGNGKDKGQEGVKVIEEQEGRGVEEIQVSKYNNCLPPHMVVFVL